jgi:hypothetical protein
LGAQGCGWALLWYYAASTALGPALLRDSFPDAGYLNKTIVALGLSAVVLVIGLALYHLDVLVASGIGIALVSLTIAVTYLKIMTSRDRAFLVSLIRGLRLPWVDKSRNQELED